MKLTKGGSPIVIPGKVIGSYMNMNENMEFVVIINNNLIDQRFNKSRHMRRYGKNNDWVGIKTKYDDISGLSKLIYEVAINNKPGRDLKIPIRFVTGRPVDVIEEILPVFWVPVPPVNDPDIVAPTGTDIQILHSLYSKEYRKTERWKSNIMFTEGTYNADVIREIVRIVNVENRKIELMRIYSMLFRNSIKYVNEDGSVLLYEDRIKAVMGTIIEVVNELGNNVVSHLDKVHNFFTYNRNGTSEYYGRNANIINQVFLATAEILPKEVKKMFLEKVASGDAVDDEYFGDTNKEKWLYSSWEYVE